MDTSKDRKLKEKLLRRSRFLLDAKVEEAINRNVLHCDYNDLAAKAARMLLEEASIGLGMGILVIKEGQPFNMISPADLIELSYMEVFDPERDFLRTKVGDIVKDKEFIHVAPDHKLRVLFNLMIKKRLHVIPVLDGNTFLGTCSIVDLIQWYHKTHDEVRTGEL